MTVTDVLHTGVGVLATLVACGRTLAADARARVAGVAEPVLRLVAWQASRGQVESARPRGAGNHAEGPQTEMQEAKYFLGAAAERPRADREEPELPRAYGDDRVVLLPRDPWWVFAYWEVTPTTRVEALRALGDDAEGAREVLRVSDVSFVIFDGHNAWSSLDIDLEPGAESGYVNVGRPAASFVAEIGLRTRSGRFVSLARSSVIATPPAQPSADTSVRWVTLRRQGAPLVTQADWASVGGSAVGADETSDSSHPTDVHVPR